MLELDLSVNYELPITTHTESPHTNFRKTNLIFKLVRNLLSTTVDSYLPS